MQITFQDYEPMIKSLHDLDHLSALFMKDSSIRTQNKATVPVEGFGTRDNPGLIQVWILSLGIQKEAFLQLLGRDELQRFKTLQPAIKYIRYRLMDVRNQSEVKHDLDSRLTPVKNDDLHRGECFTRQQTDSVPRHQYASPSPFRTNRNQPPRNQPAQPSLAALHTCPNNSTPIRTIKMTRMVIAPFMITLKTMRKTYTLTLTLA